MGPPWGKVPAPPEVGTWEAAEDRGLGGAAGTQTRGSPGETQAQVDRGPWEEGGGPLTPPSARKSRCPGAGLGRVEAAAKRLWFESWLGYFLKGDLGQGVNLCASPHLYNEDAPLSLFGGTRGGACVARPLGTPRWMQRETVGDGSRFPALLGAVPAGPGGGGGASRLLHGQGPAWLWDLSGQAWPGPR